MSMLLSHHQGTLPCHWSKVGEEERERGREEERGVLSLSLLVVVVVIVIVVACEGGRERSRWVGMRHW